MKKRILKVSIVTFVFISICSIVSAGRLGSGGVKEVYDGGYRSSQGHIIYRIVCNQGGKGSAFKQDGYWYDGTGHNYGDSFKGLSLHDFAEKACR